LVAFFICSDPALTFSKDSSKSHPLAVFFIEYSLIDNKKHTIYIHKYQSPDLSK
jgi:hypothetical protein